MLAKVLKSRKMFHSLLRIASVAQKPFTGETQYLRHLPMIFFKEHNFKRLPAIAKVPFRDRWSALEKTFKNSILKTGEKPIRVAIFSGCVQDFVYPEQLEAGIKAMLASGKNISLSFPMDQSCCGLPALIMGEKDAARDVAVQNITAFKDAGADYIVTLCASCASHLVHTSVTLAGDILGKGAEEFAGRVMPFSQFMHEVIGTIKQSDLQVQVLNEHPKKITWHSPCHLCRGLGIREAPKAVMAQTDYEFVAAVEEETCCGFGGSFSANFPAISREILTRKLDDVEKSGAEILVTECPGCILQLRGGALSQNRKFKVVHIAELITQGFDDLPR